MKMYRLAQEGCLQRDRMVPKIVGINNPEQSSGVHSVSSIYIMRLVFWISQYLNLYQLFPNFSSYMIGVNLTSRAQSWNLEKLLFLTNLITWTKHQQHKSFYPLCFGSYIMFSERNVVLVLGLSLLNRWYSQTCKPELLTCSNKLLKIGLVNVSIMDSFLSWKWFLLRNFSKRSCSLQKNCSCLGRNMMYFYQALI